MSNPVGELRKKKDKSGVEQSFLDFLDDWLERERFYDTIEDTELPVVEVGYVLSDSDIMFGKQIRKRKR